MKEIKISELSNCSTVIVRNEDLEKVKELLKKENINMYKDNSIYTSYYDFEAACYNDNLENEGLSDIELEEVSDFLRSNENMEETICNM